MKICLLLLISVCLSVATKVETDNTESHKFDTLILEGGGSKAISYVGALLAFKELGYYSNGRYSFHKIGGTSAGCFVGFLLSLDIKPSKLESLIYKLDLFRNSVNFDIDMFVAHGAPEKSSSHTWFNTILKTFALITQAQKLVDLWLDCDSPGLSTEEMFVKLMTEVILPLSPYKGDIDNLQTLTMENLLRITNHDLHCFSTQLTDRIIYEFSAERTPDENVLKAIYASMTLPGIFKPLDDGFGNTLVDGGLLCNFPIAMNDKNGHIDAYTLGLSLNSKIEHDQSVSTRYSDLNIDKTFKFKPINTIDYIGAIYSVIINREALIYSQNPANDNRVIYLDSPLGTLDFEIDHNAAVHAINTAYRNTLAFLKNIEKN